MKPTRFVGFVCAVSLVGWALALPGSVRQAEPSDPAAWSPEEKAEFLQNAKIVKRVAVLEGATQSLRLTLQSDRGTHDCQVQTIDQVVDKFEGVAGQWEINFKDTYKFNIAAYLLDRMLDLNMVPVSVERKVEGRNAAVTWWVDNVLMDEKKRLEKNEKPPVEARKKWNEQVHVLHVFDQLIANKDRNIGNILITKNWNMWLIDHTRAFRITKDLPDRGNLVKCDLTLLQAMRLLSKPALKEKMGKYLTNMEIDALLARRDKIVKYFDEQVARQGEGALLFDYLTERRALPPGALD